MSLPEGIGRILASIGSGDLVFVSLNFGWENFDLEAVSLFPKGMIKEQRERALQLDALMNHSFSWSPKLSYRTPRRGRDPSPSCTLVLSSVVVPPKGFSGVLILLPWRDAETGAYDCLFRSRDVVKMDDCLWKIISNEHYLLFSTQGLLMVAGP